MERFRWHTARYVGAGERLFWLLHPDEFRGCEHPDQVSTACGSLGLWIDGATRYQHGRVLCSERLSGRLRPGPHSCASPDQIPYLDELEFDLYADGSRAVAAS